MNILKKTVLLMLVCSMTAQAVAARTKAKEEVVKVWILNRATIDDQKEVLANYLEDNRKDRLFTKMAYISGMCIAAGALVYWLYPKNTPVQNPVTVDASTLAEIKLGQLKANLKLDEFGGLVAKMSPSVTPTVPSTVAVAGALSYWQQIKNAGVSFGSSLYDTGKYMGNVMTHQGVTIFISALGSSFFFREIPTLASMCDSLIIKPIDRICHPIDIKWFTSTQIDLKKMFEEVYETAEALPLFAPVSEEDRLHHLMSTTKAVNLLNRQLSRLVAFMELRSELVAQENKAYAKTLRGISDYVFSVVQRTTTKIADNLASNENATYEQVPAQIQSLQQLLQEECRKFYLWERSMAYDILPVEDEVSEQATAA